MTILRAQGLSGGYGAREVIRGVDLELAAGRCLAVVGPNGAGKSTLLRLLAGILPASSGSVVLMGRPLLHWRRREVALRVGLVPQIVSFAFPLSVRELVEQGRSPHLGPWRPPGSHDAAVVTEALERVGLGDRASVPIQHLSGGERQRALLARTLATEPRVLMLDEPAANLDVHHQLSFISTLRCLLADEVGILLVVHDWNLALLLADEVLVLNHGKVHATGQPTQVLNPAVLAAVFGVEVEILTRRDGASVIAPFATR